MVNTKTILSQLFCLHRGFLALSWLQIIDHRLAPEKWPLQISLVGSMELLAESF
jgi:hypothetical protein